MAHSMMPEKLPGIQLVFKYVLVDPHQRRLQGESPDNVNGVDYFLIDQNRVRGQGQRLK